MAALLAGELLRAQEPVQVMYGVPPELQDNLGAYSSAPQDTVIVKDTVAPNDTIVETLPIVEEDTLPPVPDVPMCKYGPPGGNW
ncbi:MAG: hypothetical protein J5612_00910 [Paludibacteraceae bacterium]|nr:hypothetical protein [Paludibacteraceae bacterium]